jgi:nucleotide-binding universal stress UspA family protein
MPGNRNPVEFNRALEDFRKAHSKAELQYLWSLITGQSSELLPYDEITQKLHATGFSSKGLQEIPIDSIVGSVNRYQDFNHNFLPLHNEDRQRWASVKAAMTSPGSVGLPPIRVYKLGDAYFVLDGNHRVSIAKEMGIDMVEAYVTEIKSKVPLSPEDSPADIILKEEYANFLEEARIDKILPDANLQLTFPGLYNTLIEHIRVHRHYMGNEQQREIPWEEAVRDWYEKVYLPVVRVIEQQGILDEFPDRTKTDLYIWILDHQAFMQNELGWSIRPEKAATDLVKEKNVKTKQFFRNLGRKIIQAFIPAQFTEQKTAVDLHNLKGNRGPTMFSDILVAMSGNAESWIALEQAIVLAKLEQADVRGLVVVPEDQTLTYDSNEIARVFSEKLQQAGVTGKLVYASGVISETIVERAQFNDLVVIRLSHPPIAKFIPRLESGIRTLVRKSPQPVLMVRDRLSQLDRILLAYDGSPKGKEALFISTYLASKYDKKVCVLVVDEDQEQGQFLLEEAKDYLGEQCTQVIFRKHAGLVSEVILKAARDLGSDCIVMGGYGLSPILEALFGSAVDGVLRRASIPVLVCQ